MKYLTTLYHSILVGIIAAAVVYLAALLDIKAWIVFFAWANYFLHDGNPRKAIKMFLGFIIGVLIAYLATFPYNYLTHNMVGMPEVYISVLVVFCIATALIFLEVIKNWGEFVPSTFLGTVLYYASQVTLNTVLGELFVPLLLGIFAGYVTVFTRGRLNNLLSKINN